MRLLKNIFKIAFVIIILFMLLYFLGYLKYSNAPVIRKTVENDSTLPVLKIKNCKFHCETYGDTTNQMIMVIHGGPGADYRYLLELKSFSKNYFVVFFDQRGTGLSQRQSEEYLVYDTAIADIYDIIRYYKPDQKVILLGHSWGAMLASGFLNKYPAMVERAILAEPGFLTKEMANKYFKVTNGMRPRFSARALKYLLKSYFKSLHIKEPDANASKDYFYRQLMFGKFKGHPLEKYFCNSKIDYDCILFWRTGAIAAQEMMASVFNEKGELKVDFSSKLHNIDVPVLLMASECNQIIGYEFQKMHLDLFQNADLKDISDSGHYMFNENFNECYKVITEFLTVNN